MALVSSNPFELGKKAPDFKLLNTLSREFTELNQLKGSKGTVIMFICNHCPYVKHINNRLVKVANQYIEAGISFIAISSNDVTKYPQDGPDKMRETAIEEKYPFPYLFDETQEVARAYDAACTPDYYLFDQNLKAVYHGQFDSSRPGNDIPVTGDDLIKAMNRLLNGEPPIADQKPSIGCSIKWMDL